MQCNDGYTRKSQTYLQSDEWIGLRTGLRPRLRTGLRTGLRPRLRTGLRTGLRPRLRTGLRTVNRIVESSQSMKCFTNILL